MATYDVADRSAIVTGAGSGIGKAVAALLAANGAAVLVTDLRQDVVDAAVAELVDAGYAAAGLAADSSDPASGPAAVEAANALAPLRIAVNNAGIGGAMAPVGEYPLDSWRQVIDVNLNGVMYGMRAQLPAIAANGGRRRRQRCIDPGQRRVRQLLGLRHRQARGARADQERGAGVRRRPGSGSMPSGPDSSSPPWSRRTWTPTPGPSWRPNTRSAGSARPTRWPRWSPSWRRTRRASSPAATTWWTVATPPSEAVGRWADLGSENGILGQASRSMIIAMP